MRLVEIKQPSCDKCGLPMQRDHHAQCDRCGYKVSDEKVKQIRNYYKRGSKDAMGPK